MLKEKRSLLQKNPVPRENRDFYDFRMMSLSVCKS